jgi:hypothetical protein
MDSKKMIQLLMTKLVVVMQHGILNIEEGGRGWTGTFHDVIDAVKSPVKFRGPFPADLSRLVILGHQQEDTWLFG